MIDSDFFFLDTHLLLLGNDIILSDFMTKAFENCSFVTYKAQQLFLAMFCFCSFLGVITTSALLTEAAMLCVHSMPTWLSSLFYFTFIIQILHSFFSSSP